MGKYLRVSMVGAGNLATHLALALENAGHTICQIVAPRSAGVLAGQLFSATAQEDPDLSGSEAQVVIMAVPDDLIPKVAAELILPEGAVLAHTSGSRSIRELSAYDGPHGVIYPLQTFSKGKPVRFETVPFCLEADGEEAEEALYTLATSLSREVYWMGHEQRRALHVSAVFASNFTNHLLSIAGQILEREGLNGKLLRPLIKETLDKALLMGPLDAQTGPALRGDEVTINQHLQYLGDDRDWHRIYQALSESIQTTHEQMEDALPDDTD